MAARIIADGVRLGRVIAGRAGPKPGSGPMSPRRPAASLADRLRKSEAAWNHRKAGVRSGRFDLAHVLEDGNARILIDVRCGVGRDGGRRHLLWRDVVGTHDGRDVEGANAIVRQPIAQFGDYGLRQRFCSALIPIRIALLPHRLGSIPESGVVIGSSRLIDNPAVPELCRLLPAEANSHDMLLPGWAFRPPKFDPHFAILDELRYLFSPRPEESEMRQKARDGRSHQAARKSVRFCPATRNGCSLAPIGNTIGEPPPS